MRANMLSSAKAAPEHSDFGVVLVVDDDPAWVEACCSMLELMGYLTAKALTIPEAFEQLANNDVSTVLVDYRMPGGDGISLIYAMSGRSALHRRKFTSFWRPPTPAWTLPSALSVRQLSICSRSLLRLQRLTLLCCAFAHLRGSLKWLTRFPPS